MNSTSAAQLVKLTNYGHSALNITKISLSGSNSPDFSEKNNCGNLLQLGASCTIETTFKPSQIGLRSAILSIADNASGTSSQTVSLKGAGTVVSLSPDSLNFGAIGVGGSKVLATVLTNKGTEVVSLSHITATGSGFSQSNDCGSRIAPGASCTITVTFRPGAGGWNGTVFVFDNGGASPQMVPLSGTGRLI